MLVCVLACIGCATVEHSQVPPSLIPGEACPYPNAVEFWDGGDIMEIEGKLVTRDVENAMRPVRAATLVVWYQRDDSNARRSKLRVHRDGTFKAKVVLSTSGCLRCQDGVVVETTKTEEAELAIQAPGCTDYRLIVGLAWEPHEIELQCDARWHSG